MLQEAVMEHKRTYSDDYMRDFIDVFLKEMKRQEKTQESHSFSGGFQYVVLSTRQILQSKQY
jgi:hypothetical protein